jgi:glycosyltransferase involved in cell wall biosynthesis
MDLEKSLQKILFAIPSINGGHLLSRMLPSLKIPSELVLVLDQGSSDDTEQICKSAGVNLVQLSTARTYTEACNIAAEIARERGCDYLFVANNDVVFMTDVARELLAELIADPNLGIVAPAQLVIEPASRRLAYRASWRLETLTFEHDYNAPTGTPYRLEADFCELTVAGIRMAAIDKVGFLDNKYGFYHEDADFGFRLRQAGYTCAYLPNSQIEHWSHSTFSKVPGQLHSFYIPRNKQLFSAKFLGHHLAHTKHKSKETDSWSIINKNLHAYLNKFGLLNPSYPELIFSHPGTQPFDYLFTIWETSQLPEAWLDLRNSYKVVMTPSRWGLDVLRSANFARAHYVPLGVESDVFQPWGRLERFSDCKTFLWFARNQYRKGLDVMLSAWRTFYNERPHARLILMGNGIVNVMDEPESIRIWKQFQIAEYPSDGISVYESIAPMDEETLATIYRSVDFTVCSSRAEGFGYSVAESMACGTPAIFGYFSAMQQFATNRALLLRGTPILADYSDKGFTNVGSWWEPSVEHLTELLIEAHDMDVARYGELAQAGVRLIRTKFSWRTTCFAIREALIAEDEGRVPTEAKKLPPSLRAIADTQDKFVSEVDSVPWRRFCARTIRRVDFLCTYFRERLEEKGIRHAMASSADILVLPFLQSRAVWLRQRTELALQNALRRLTAPKGEDGASKEPLDTRPGVLFVGYAEGTLGLGQAFRANLAAAASADIPFGIYPLRTGVETRLAELHLPDRYDDRHAYTVSIIQVAGDQVPTVFQTVDARIVQDSYRILATYWELSSAPKAWRNKLAGINEIWAPNKFVADAFARIFDGPILIMPPAVEPTGDTYPGRACYGMDESRFYFMFSFDYYSSPFRKNPLGVIEAFEKAFPRTRQDVGLIIKSIGASQRYPKLKVALEQVTSRDQRILLMEKTLSRTDVLGLIRSSDAYLSLHRSEGFGLGMVEALSFGRTVIGTGYSGCTDFLNEQTGYPVPYVLRPVLPHEYHYSKGQIWAEPDLDAAVEIMRNVVANPAEARRRAAVGRLLVHERYGINPVGRRMRARISEVLDLPDEIG